MLKGHSVFVIELCPISFPFPLLSNVSHVGQNDADIVQCSPLNSLPGAFLVCQNKIKSNVPLKGEDMGKGWWMEDGGWGMGGCWARPGPSNIQATQARTGKFQHINIFQLSRPCSLLVFTFQPLTSPRHTATPFTPFLFFFFVFSMKIFPTKPTFIVLLNLLATILCKFSCSFNCINVSNVVGGG